MAMIVPPTQAQQSEPTYESGKLYAIELENQQPDPDQPRKYFDEAALQELADSIGKHSVLQPILFRKDPSGQLFIVAGERRYAAAKRVGAPSIPTIFTEGDPSEISLIENLIRENLTAVEEAEAMQQVLDKHGYSQEDLAKVIGKDQTTVSKVLSINRLPQELRDDCRAKSRCPKTILIEIAKKETPKEMKSFYDKCKRQGLLGDPTEQKPARTRIVQEKADAAVVCSVKLKKSLSEIDMNNLSEGRRTSLRDEPSSLKTVVDEFLLNTGT